MYFVPHILTIIIERNSIYVLYYFMSFLKQLSHYFKYTSKFLIFATFPDHTPYKKQHQKYLEERMIGNMVPSF